MNNPTNYPPTPRTLKQVKADPRVESVEFCDQEGRYFVELSDGWTEDDCIGFSARTVKALISTLCGCVRGGSEVQAPPKGQALLDVDAAIAQLRAELAKNDRDAKARRGRPFQALN